MKCSLINVILLSKYFAGTISKLDARHNWNATEYGHCALGKDN